MQSLVKVKNKPTTDEFLMKNEFLNTSFCIAHRSKCEYGSQTLYNHVISLRQNYLKSN